MNLIQFRSHTGELLHQITYPHSIFTTLSEVDRLELLMDALPIRVYAADLTGVPFYAAFEKAPT